MGLLFLSGLPFFGPPAMRRGGPRHVGRDGRGPPRRDVGPHGLRLGPSRWLWLAGDCCRRRWQCGLQQQVGSPDARVTPQTIVSKDSFCAPANESDPKSVQALALNPLNLGVFKDSPWSIQFVKDNLAQASPADQVSTRPSTARSWRRGGTAFGCGTAKFVRAYTIAVQAVERVDRPPGVWLDWGKLRLCGTPRGARRHLRERRRLRRFAAPPRAPQHGAPETPHLHHVDSL